MIDLDEAERLGKAATDAPWTLDNAAFQPDDERDLADMAFNMFARNNWQSLVDELRELRTVRTVASQQLTELMAICEARLRELVGERDEARAAAKWLLSCQGHRGFSREGAIVAWPWLTHITHHLPSHIATPNESNDERE